ncbi:MAG: DUF3267 domain-containing protein [Chloroflexota bacterium]
MDQPKALKARRDLPGGYRLRRDIDLSSDLQLLLALNLAGLALLLAALVGFGQLAQAAHPGFRAAGLLGGQLAPGLTGALAQVGLYLLAFGLTLALHELVHGLFFWLFTGERPVFGLKLSYAYAAAPDWYLPRSRYLIVGLAPLVALTALGLALLPGLPDELLGAWLLAMITSTSGAVGDLYVVGYLLTCPPASLVRDRGDGMAIYIPGSAAEAAE